MESDSLFCVLEDEGAYFLNVYVRDSATAIILPFGGAETVSVNVVRVDI